MVAQPNDDHIQRKTLKEGEEKVIACYIPSKALGFWKAPQHIKEVKDAAEEGTIRPTEAILRAEAEKKLQS